MPAPSKTKTNQKRLDAAVQSFHARYASPDQYGEERWKGDLVPALTQPTTYVALVNAFVGVDKVLQFFNKAGIVDERLRYLAFHKSNPVGDNGSTSELPKLVCLAHTAFEPHERTGTVNNTTGKVCGSMLPFPAPSRLASVISSGEELFSHWNMDAASVLAASMIQAQPGDRVLDLCSAPGGKSVALSQTLFAHLLNKSVSMSTTISSRTVLHCNEIDNQRHKRLSANLQAYLPAEVFASKSVSILKVDASTKTALASLPCGENGYDKVLIDAPCSSERHILHAHIKATQSGQIADEMLNWKPSHSQTLAKTQVGLLTNGLLAVRLGGRVVYATCALGREENDLVVETVLSNLKKEHKREKALNTNKWNWDLDFGVGSDVDISMLDQMTEPTKYGRIALPDKGGWGPLYFCVMTKVERKKKSRTVANEM